MNQTFYVQHRGDRLGPFTAEEIRKRIERNELGGEDLVGVGDQWVSLSAWQESAPGAGVDGGRRKGTPRWVFVLLAGLVVLGLAVAGLLVRSFAADAAKDARTTRDAAPEFETDVSTLAEDCKAHGPGCADLNIDQVVSVRGEFVGTDVGSDVGDLGSRDRFAIVARDAEADDRLNFVVRCYFAKDSTSAETASTMNAKVRVQGVSFGVRRNESGGGAMVLAHRRIKK